MITKEADVAIIGAGPAGMSAAIKARELGAKKVLLLERSETPGGLLHQCIHNGFGLSYFGEDFTGPEYACWFIEKAADIGVAMGESGTNVARDVSDVVLEDDNLHTMAIAVSQGRTIYNNIRKMIHFMISTNLTEIEVMLAGLVLGIGQPMNPMQLLWINLVTNGFQVIALAFEPGEKDVDQRPPRNPREGIMSSVLVQRTVIVGLLIGGLTLAMQAWTWSRDQAEWQTMVFTVLVVAQLFHCLAIRSERDSLWRIGLFSNPALLGTVIFTIGLQLMVIYVPAFNPLFHTQPLPLPELLACLALSSLVLFAVEIEKWLVRRRNILSGMENPRLDRMLQIRHQTNQVAFQSAAL